MPWAIMVFGFLSIIPLLTTALFGWRTFDAASAMLRGEERLQTICLDVAPPPICMTTEAYPAFLPSAVGLVISILGLVACWVLAARKRAVWMDGDGTMRVTWGDGRGPVVLRRFLLEALSDFSVTRERRVTLSPIVGTSVTRVGRAPDRWRLRATFKGGTADLGSYPSEEAAKKIVRLVTSVRNNEQDDESGIWYYGRSN